MRVEKPFGAHLGVETISPAGTSSTAMRVRYNGKVLHYGNTPDFHSNGEVRRFAHDDTDYAGRIVASNRYPNSWVSPPYVTQFAYDQAGRQYKVTNALGTITETTFNGLAQAVSVKVGTNAGSATVQANE